jgi:hypothetical protein
LQAANTMGAPRQSPPPDTMLPHGESSGLHVRDGMVHIDPIIMI